MRSAFRVSDPLTSSPARRRPRVGLGLTGAIGEPGGDGCAALLVLTAADAASRRGSNESIALAVWRRGEGRGAGRSKRSAWSSQLGPRPPDAWSAPRRRRRDRPSSGYLHAARHGVAGCRQGLRSGRRASEGDGTYGATLGQGRSGLYLGTGKARVPRGRGLHSPFFTIRTDVCDSGLAEAKPVMITGLLTVLLTRLRRAAPSICSGR